MFQKIIRGALTLAGALAGYAISVLLIRFAEVQDWVYIPAITPIIRLIISGIGVLAGAIIFFLITPWLMKKGLHSASKLEGEILKLPAADVAFGSIGLIIGLLIAYLISQLLMQIPIFLVGSVLSVILYIFLGYLGVSIATTKREELLNLTLLFKKNVSGKEKGTHKKGGSLPENSRYERDY